MMTVPAYAESASGSVYYLNFKPEQATQWEELAAAYTEEGYGGDRGVRHL